VKKPSINFKIPPYVFDAVYRMPAWQKALIFAASWIIPIALFWFLFFSGKIGELDSISTRIPKLRQEVKQLEAKKKLLPKLEKELEGLQEILKQAMRLLPEKEDIPSVLTEISSLGNESRLEFKSFRPGKEVVHDFYASIPVSLEFQGPFHNTLVFFDHIAKMARIVHITEVNMGGAKQSKAIFSQTANNSGQGGSGAAQTSGGSNGETGGDADSLLRGSSWVINTKCNAATYRFLTPEEIKAIEKQKKGRKKRNR